MLNWFLIFLGCFGILFLNQIEIKIIGLIFLWAYLDTVLATITILSNELLINPYRNMSGLIFLTFHSLGGLFGTTLTLCLTHYKHIILFYSTGLTIASCLVLFFIPTSPAYLLRRNKNQKFKNSLKYIGIVNR